MYTLEHARIVDTDARNQIIGEGRQFQREQGFVQWTDDYPNIDTVRGDIADPRGYRSFEQADAAHSDKERLFPLRKHYLSGKRKAGIR